MLGTDDQCLTYVSNTSYHGLSGRRHKAFCKLESMINVKVLKVIVPKWLLILNISWKSNPLLSLRVEFMDLFS